MAQVDCARHSISSSTNDGEVGGIPLNSLRIFASFFVPFLHSLSCVFMLVSYAIVALAPRSVVFLFYFATVENKSSIIRRQLGRGASSIVLPSCEKGIESIKIV
jgi:hypothetical protein